MRYLVSKYYRFLCLLILVQLFASISFAQNYVTKVYDEGLGLYQKVISEILRDDDGFFIKLGLK
mgnify:CR=1 FL=1